MADYALELNDAEIIAVDASGELPDGGKFPHSCARAITDNRSGDAKRCPFKRKTLMLAHS